MYKLLRGVVLAFAAFSLIGEAQPESKEQQGLNATDSGIANTSASHSPPRASATTTGLGNGTCSSRKANYITHTLPQQCLRTDRVTANASRSTPSGEATSADASQPSPLGMVSESPIGSSRHPNDHLSAPWLDDLTASTSDIAGDSTFIAGTTTESSLTASSTTSEAEPETDSPLDTAYFLSFEEWKRQNQVKAEQAAEHGGSPFGSDRQRPGINNALDSLGDEGEIELDFSGFGGAASAPRQQQAAYRTANVAAAEKIASAPQTPRSKDAGKTCKERTNYASFDCAATVLKSNPECKSASSVLVENKDSYMLNTCSANNKFFIVELCNDIEIDTIVLANYEFFSSIFRHFRVSASETYPVKMNKWTDLGTFEARNTRDVQAFLIQHPQIWARYLRIEFLTHYGSEYYCPVSVLRVHGTTMLEDWRQQDDAAHTELVENEQTLETEPALMPIISQEPASSTGEIMKETVQSILTVEDIEATVSMIPTETSESSNMKPEPTVSPAEAESDLFHTWTVNVSGVLTSVAIPLIEETTCASSTASQSTEGLLKSGSASEPSSDAQSATPTDPNHGIAISNRDAELTHTDETSRSYLSSANSSTMLLSKLSRSDLNISAENGTSASSSASVSPIPASSDSTDLTSSSGGPSTASPSSPSSSRSATTTASTAAQPQPSTQESFFKSIHKRLQQLESNSTLSLQYIEEQSRILRDAFSKVEKRQISATTSFLTNLNETAMMELRGFRQAYDQLWQSTVLELEGQREQYQREMLAVSTRLTLVADELVWQKRMGIVQSTLLLLCLGLVLFARPGNGSGYLEVPLMQQMMNKSQSALSRPNAPEGWESPPASPSPESRSPVSLFRRRLLWRSVTEPSVRGSETDSRPATREGPEYESLAAAVDVKVEPPTPESERAVITPEIEADTDGEDDVFDAREVQSSPPTPTGTREREREDVPPDIRDG